jgi:hypothetical protein
MTLHKPPHPGEFIWSLLLLPADNLPQSWVFPHLPLAPSDGNNCLWYILYNFPETNLFNILFSRRAD